MNIAIPLTPQTDASKFPPYEFREYPKVVGEKADKTPLIANDENHERQLRSAGLISEKKPVKTSASEVERLERENAEMKAQLARLNRPAAMAPVAAEKPKNKGGRPRKNAAPEPAPITQRASQAPAAPVVEEPSEDDKEREARDNLVRICGELNIKPNPQWSIDQLRTAIENAS